MIVADPRRELYEHLRTYSSMLYWKFILTDELSVSLPLAQISCGEDVFLVNGNAIIWENAFKLLKENKKKTPVAIGNAYKIPDHILEHVDPYAENITKNMIEHCQQFPLSTDEYHPLPSSAEYLIYMRTCFDIFSVTTPHTREENAMVLVGEAAEPCYPNGKAKIIETFTNER